MREGQKPFRNRLRLARSVTAGSIIAFMLGRGLSLPMSSLETGETSLNETLDRSTGRRDAGSH